MCILTSVVCIYVYMCILTSVVCHISNVTSLCLCVHFVAPVTLCSSSSGSSSSSSSISSSAVNSINTVVS